MEPSEKMDEPNFEPLADVVEQVVWKGNSSDYVSGDESCKLEEKTSASSVDATYALCFETETNLKTDTDRTGEVSLSTDVKPTEVGEHSIVNDGQGMVSPGENLLDRQVAIEVEREVVDCEEESSSTSDAALESVNQLADNLANEPENLANNQQVNAKQEMESSQVTDGELNLLPSGNTIVCGFDLNEEVCQEKIDVPPIVDGSTSSGATAPEMQDCHSIDLDLNTNGSLDEESIEPVTESCVEAHQRITEKPKLDLNYAIEDSDDASDSQAKDGYGYNGINLNDYPSLESAPTAMDAFNNSTSLHKSTSTYVKHGPGSHVDDPSELNLDLNTGQRLFAGYGQRLFAGYGGSMEDESHQTSNLIAGKKRREPDSGWESEQQMLPFKLLRPTSK